MKFTEFMNRVIKITMDNRGRIYLPKSLRNALKIQNDDELFVLMEGDCFCVYTAKGIEKKISSLVM